MNTKEQFEAWYLERWGHTEDDHATLFERGPDGDEYYRLGVRMAHEAWQAASKASEQQLTESRREFTAENATIHNLELKVEQVVAENAALINSSACTLQEGRPPHGFYASEWFIAKLKNGEYAALKALPEEYSYDYRTNDGTYYTNDWVVGWMQTPDTEYRPNIKTPATDAYLAEMRAQGVDAAIEQLIKKFEGTGHIGVPVMVLESFAAQLRQGEKS